MTFSGYNDCTMSANTPLSTTRERILAYLKENRTTTISALSRAWGLTRADIRYHMNALIDDGLVERVPRDKSLPAGRGRPAQAYRLADRSTPDNYPQLCSALLAALLGSLDDDREKEAVLKSLAEKLSSERYIPPAAPTQRFNQATAFLNRHSYHARWEASAAGPRLLLRNCPYAAIVGQHPELCTLDRLLLERLLQMPLRHAVRMNLATGAPPACVFVARA